MEAIMFRAMMHVLILVYGVCLMASMYLHVMAWAGHGIGIGFAAKLIFGYLAMMAFAKVLHGVSTGAWSKGMKMPRTLSLTMTCTIVCLFVLIIVSIGLCEPTKGDLVSACWWRVISGFVMGFTLCSLCVLLAAVSHKRDPGALDDRERA